MTWKSRGDRLEQLERPRRARVVEGHERIVEDERRPAVAGHEPDQPEPGDEVDEVERALAQRADRDPVVLLGGVDLDVERLVVDPDAPVATAGHGREVADHVRLEVAGRGLHRRLLGPVDGGERRGEDPLATLCARPAARARRPAARPARRPARRRRRWPRPGRGRWPRRRAPARGRPPGRGPRPRAARGRAAPWRSARAPRARSSSARSRAPRRRAASAASRSAPCRRVPRAGRSAGRSGRRAPPRATSRSSAAARSVSPSAPSCASALASASGARPPSRSGRAGAGRSRRRASAACSL